MQYFDKVGYNGTRVDAVTFSVAVANGHNAIPDNVETEFYVDDGTNRSAAVGYIASGQWHFVRNVPGYNWPTNFGNNVDIVATVSAETLNRKLDGVAVVAIGGQSEAVGWNFGKDLAIDYPRDYVQEFVSGASYPRIASEPLDHPDDGAQALTADSVTFAIHWGERLRREGFNLVQLVAGGWGSTSFFGGHWVKGGARYNYFRQKIRDCLNSSGKHYLNEIVMAIGQSDAFSGVSTAQFETYMIDFADDIKHRS